MKYLNAKIVLFAGLLLLNLSCSTTKKVPEGEYLLMKNNFEFEGNEKPFKSKIPDYVKQSPNASFLGMPIQLLIYNSVPQKFDTVFMEYQDLSKLRRNRKSLDSLLVKHGLEDYKGRNLWWKRLKFNQGEPPVLIDTANTSFSAENLEIFFTDRGYFDAEVMVENKLDSATRKGEITYKINPGEVSRINQYTYDIKDTVISNFYGKTWLGRNSNIKEGDRYDMDNFVAERDRIVNYLKNRGYWRFNDDGQAIEFTADTTYSTKALDITLNIPPQRNDSITLNTKFKRYRYGKINIYPDGKDDQAIYLDTVHNGFHFHYLNPKMKYRPQFFTDAMVIKSGEYYSYNSEVQTRRNLSKREGITLNAFGYIPDNLDVEGDNNLDLDLVFQPKKKYDFFYGAELSWSEFMNFGVSPNVSLVARNLFRGGEDLETSVRGTFGNVNRRFTSESGFFNAFELAFQATLKFPYLLFPANTDNLFPNRFYKQTDLRLGASLQNNIGLGRMTYSTGLDYNISFQDSKNHTISVLNTEFVNNLQRDNYFQVFSGDYAIMSDFFNQYYFMYNPAAGIMHFNQTLSDDAVIAMALNDSEFLNSLDPKGLEALSVFENMNFRKQTITQNVLISSLVYQFTSSQTDRSWLKNQWYFRARIEFAGNLLKVLDRAFGFNRIETASGKASGTVLGIPYSQFVKLDLDLRRYFKLKGQSMLATRAYFGIIQPYGNTDFIPFARSYTAGGANDVRAWAAATLGPSDLPRYASGEDVFAIDQLKILLSAEYRFNVAGILNSALFVDAGNIWGTDKNDELTLFRFQDFYKQLGIGTGFGIRLNFTYFLLRFDFAYKIHDPSYPIGERWRFNDLNLLQPHFTFGINYPF
ncbi:MAG: BamA/TamA family outer membrane protein [Weeksellaceae bacterium]